MVLKELAWWATFCRVGLSATWCLGSTPKAAGTRASQEDHGHGPRGPGEFLVLVCLLFPNREINRSRNRRGLRFHLP